MNNSFLKSRKIGFIGAGNMTKSLIGGLSLGKGFDPSQIWVSNRSSHKLKEISDRFGVNVSEHNEKVVEECDWIVLSIKPQDVEAFLEQQEKDFTEDKVILSVCAGITFSALSRNLKQVGNIIRLMPTTTCEIGEGVLGVYGQNEDLVEAVMEFFSPVGYVVHADTEEALDKVMISAASGVGFILEIMQIWSEWLTEDNQFSKEEADQITEKSFSGLMNLVKSNDKSFAKLQSEVTSKKGVTLAGLESMRHSEIDRVLRLGFAAALKRSNELGK